LGVEFDRLCEKRFLVGEEEEEEGLEGDFLDGEAEDFLEGDLRAAEKEERGESGNGEIGGGGE